MAEFETITILKVGTNEAVKSVQDLRDNVKALKTTLDGLEIGTEEYQNTLNELRLNQNALRDSMYATSASLEDVAQSASGAGESYNALVHRMAALKEEFRSTTDVMRRAELGQQIKEVNDQLKDLDALQGNFQRNVGNYTESIKKAFSEMPEYANPLKKSFEDVNKSMNLLSTNPLIGIITLLFPLIQKITEQVKQNNTAIESTEKLMTSLQPVMDFFTGIIDRIAEALGDVITKVASFLGSSGLMQKVISGVTGVGNAILQFIIAPVKGIAAAFKVLQDEGIKGIGNAAKALWGEVTSGASFKTNFEAGQAVGEAIISGAKSKKAEAHAAGKEIAKEVTDGMAEAFDEYTDADIAAENAAIEAETKLLETQAKLQANAVNEIIGQTVENLRKQEEEAKAAEALTAEMARQAAEEERQRLEGRVAAYMGMASSISAIMGSIASLYEADGEASAKAAQHAKNLNIASATIDMLTGAVSAYKSGVESVPIPAWAGVALGAAQAAAVIAAGTASIAQIRATDVSGNAPAAGGSVSALMPAVVGAPIFDTAVPQTTIIPSASDEARINEPVEAYIVDSKLQARQRYNASIRDKTSW